MNNSTTATAPNFCHPVSLLENANKPKLVKKLTAEANSVARILLLNRLIRKTCPPWKIIASGGSEQVRERKIGGKNNLKRH